MGNTQGASQGQVISQKPIERPPEPPYNGPSAQYQFVNVDVVLNHQVNFSFLSTQMITTNVDAYYGLLAQQYEQGYRLLTFYHIPGQTQQTGGIFSTNVAVPFQGVFCRYPQAPSNERFQLRIEKSVIQPQIVWNGWITTKSDVVTDTSHLFQTIANNTQNGGRLICIELTGQTQTQVSLNMAGRMPILGCDLIFEVPMERPSETYVYNVVCGAINISISAGLRPTPKVQFDWYGMLAHNLGQGYKLVEIFMDRTQSSQNSGFSARSQLNSQWIFEKPSSRVNDNTPYYQGTIVEHEITVTPGFRGTRASVNWEPVIQDMGNKGWELACFLETPEIRYSGLSTMHMKVLIFFQRRILN